METETQRRCPRCSQSGALHARILWLLDEAGTRTLNGVEIRCQKCDYERRLVAAEVPAHVKRA